MDNFEDNIRVKKSWRGFSKKVLSPYQNRQWQISKSGVLTRCKPKYQQTKCNVDWTQVLRYQSTAFYYHSIRRIGDLKLFFYFKNLRAVGKSCYDGSLQNLKALGYDTAIGSDGWPVGP